MGDPRISWVRGETREGPAELIGVLEIRGDGSFRAVIAERNEVDGRCHIRLARTTWGGKDALDTKWWSLVIGRHDQRVATIRNGSCGDKILATDVPRIRLALEQLELHTERTFIAVDDGPPALPWYRR